MTKTTPKKDTLLLHREFLDLLHHSYEDIVLGKTASEDAREKLLKLGAELAHAMSADMRDAMLWRAIRDGVESAFAEAEFSRGAKKGRMN